MINLNSQRTQWQVVIGAEFCKFDRPLEYILSDISKNGFTYYFICHDLDTNPDGLPKFKHYHLVLTNIKRTRAKQIINMLTDLFVCLDENIQIQDCTNLVASVQYLIHKNNPEKYQYDESLIITNDSWHNFDNLMRSKVKVDTITTEYLYAICTDPSTNIKSVLLAIGIGNFNCYFHTIKTLFECSGKMWK